MSDYPLKDLARFTEYKGAKCGLLIDCPNCGIPGGVYFRNPIGDGAEFLKVFAGRPLWDRTGETLETMSLSPSVLMYDHFHSWIRDGKLCVDSLFSCRPKAERLAEEERQEERLRREIAERSK